MGIPNELELLICCYIITVVMLFVRVLLDKYAKDDAEDIKIEQDDKVIRRRERRKLERREKYKSKLK